MATVVEVHDPEPAVCFCNARSPIASFAQQRLMLSAPEDVPTISTYELRAGSMNRVRSLVEQVYGEEK
jgi:hypothetical protein